MMPKQSIGRKVESMVSDEKKFHFECIDNLFWKTGLPCPREGIYNCACFSADVAKGYVETVQIDSKEGKALWIQQEGDSQTLVEPSMRGKVAGVGAGNAFRMMFQA